MTTTNTWTSHTLKAAIDEIIDAYEAVQRQARETYEAVRRQAWETYEAVERPAWETYEAESLEVLRLLPDLDAIDALAKESAWCSTYTGYREDAEDAGALKPISEQTNDDTAEGADGAE